MRIRDLNRSMRRTAGAQLSLWQQAFAAMRQYGMTYIGPAPNITGDGAPNLLSAPEFANGVTDAPSRQGLVTASTLAGYDGAIAFGYDGTTTSTAYKNFATTAGLTYTISVIVRMDDGLAPSFSGSATGSGSPFALVIDSAVAGGPGATVEHLGDAVYRVSIALTATGAFTGCGVAKYATNNNRTFRVTGYKLEQGSVATAYTPQSVLRQRGAYTDSAGTTPVTAVGDLFGLLLDRCGTVGQNIFTDTGVTFAGEASRVSPGVYRIYSSAGVYAAVAVLAAPAGRSFEVTFNVDSVTVAGGGFAVDPGSVPIPATVGPKRIVLVNAPTTIAIKRAGTAMDVQISNVIIKELTGNHATQPTPAQKPTLVRVPKRLGPNLVRNGTFDSGTTEWTQIGGVSQSASGGVLTVTSVGAAGGSFQDVLTQAATVKITVRARNVSGSGSHIRGLAQTGGFANATVAAVSSTSWQDYPLVVNRISGASGVRVYITAQTNPGAIEVDSVEVQEVLEWSYAMSFDGSNDFLQTGITTGNEGWICAGVTPANTTTAMSIVNAGEGTTTIPGVWLFSASGLWQASAANGSARHKADVPMAGTQPQVVSMGWNASGIFVGVNTTYSEITARTGDCSSAANTLRIGMYQGSTNPFNGPMTATVISPIYPPASVRTLIRKFIGSLQGQTL